MKKAISFVFFIYMSSCYANMFYINTQYGVLLVDIDNDGDITSISYNNGQFTFSNITTLQLVLTHDSACPVLAELLAYFLQAGNPSSLSSHGSGSDLEENFILFANNYDYEIITETYSSDDSFFCIPNSALAQLPDTGKTYNCMFNCPYSYFHNSGRTNHYDHHHFSQYQAIKEKYRDQTTCPICNSIIINFLSLCVHINKYHKGKSYAEF